MKQTMTTAAAPIEGFAVETHDGLLFTVKGLIHPPSRVVAYLRYVPDPRGDRVRGGRRYRRIYGFREQEDALTTTDGYLVYDHVFGQQVQGVPRREIRRIHDPCRRTGLLLREGARDPLEADAVSLISLLAREAGVAPTSIGVTGSLLLHVHGADSDVDLVVYGVAESRAVRGALARLFADPAAPVRSPSPAELTDVYEQHRSESPLDWRDFVRLQGRKVNEGRFRDRPFFIRFVKRACEYGEAYGDSRVEPAGVTSLIGRVVDDSDALFTPCRYGLAQVGVIGGPEASDVREIVSFRGRFAEQASVGERVFARGRLERVTVRDGAAYHRLVVGSLPGDYMKVAAG